MTDLPTDPPVTDTPETPQPCRRSSVAFLSYLFVCFSGIGCGLGSMALTFYWFVKIATLPPNEFGIFFLMIDAVLFGAGLISAIGFFVCFSDGLRKYDSYQQGEEVSPSWLWMLAIYVFLVTFAMLPVIFILLHF